ncbi:hypothetical protein GGI15_003287 [Coemansia interrupta]|uniref:Uncharacterized protein n=1 Tax=Coemansia interrupta TaxID=1126814 RepID=A0A9W8HA38_9FUNG|nr:hypothetical protein GGI15_003287 [Coemansia interrupta]
MEGIENGADTMDAPVEKQEVVLSTEMEVEPAVNVEASNSHAETIEAETVTVEGAVSKEGEAVENGAEEEPLRTPTKAGNGIQKQASLSDAIIGATPGRHAEPQYKCVYPPSETAQSLIVEHFGFLPISFIDEIINAANDTIYRATDALSKFVEKEQGSSEATSQAVNKAETLLEHSVDKNFDKFELYALRNLFNIPQGLEDYIVVPHRREDTGPAVYAEDEAELDKRLEEVRKQLIANNLLKTRLQSDNAKIERSVRRIRALNDQLRVHDIAADVYKGAEPVTAASVRERGDEISQLVERVEKLNFLSQPGSGALASTALNEPSGRDVYLARMAELQVSDWQSRQVQTPTK